MEEEEEDVETVICYRGMSSGVQKGQVGASKHDLGKNSLQMEREVVADCQLVPAFDTRRTVNSSIMFNEPKNLCNSSISWDSVGVRLQ
ncbi:hypothetical protein PS1_001802 [Malus domestica]